MKMIRYFWTLFSVLLTFQLFLNSAYAFGPIMIEPYVGYGFGSYKTSMELLGVSADQKATTNGIGYGLRIGPKIGPLFIALDASSHLLKLTPSGNGSATNETNNMIGADIGVSVPVLPLRFWAGYHFIDELTAGDTGKLSGSSYKFGAGIRPIPFITFNIEYIKHEYNKLTLTDGTSSSLPYETPLIKLSKVDMSTILISLGVEI